MALNCVGNGKILKENIFENIWVQPAAGDAGGALGGAYSVYYQELNKQRTLNSSELDKMEGAYLGPKYSRDEIKTYLDSVNAVYELVENEDLLLDRVASDLASQKVIGWHQGRLEFGPRSLGNRSIIADARSKIMQSTLNLKIKYRESFRPFAPSILREKLSNWYDIDVDSPYMLLVAPVKKDKQYAMSKSDQALFGIDKLNVSRSEIHRCYPCRLFSKNSNGSQTNKPTFSSLNL